MILFEVAVVAAFITRMPNATITLAALGGVVWPVAFLLESPVWMLLSASTALSRSNERYKELLSFAYGLVALLFSVHFIISCTPVYFLFVEGVLGATPEISNKARIGLILSLPWTLLTADRRVHQGVLIRFEDPKSLAVGTALRMCALSLGLAIGTKYFPEHGVAVAASMGTFGLACEALFIRVMFARNVRFSTNATHSRMGFRALLTYYIPLSLTSLVGMLRQPISSAAMFRMPLPVLSIAAIPLVRTVSDAFLSIAYSYVEVVVSKGEEIDTLAVLHRVTFLSAFLGSFALLLIAITPACDFWLGTILGAPDNLVELAKLSLLLLVPTPALFIFQSFFQGRLMLTGSTTHIVKAMVANAFSLALLLSIAVYVCKLPGVFAVTGSITLAAFVQTCWLWLKAE